MSLHSTTNGKRPHVETRPRAMTEKRAAHIQRMNAAKKKYHGEHGYQSRLFRIWKCMNFRCSRPSHRAFPRYGGRGIAVCDEWQLDYCAFRDWSVAHGYTDTSTIDRIDNDGSYTAANCRWATMREQNNNRRNNVLVTAWNETKTVKEWSRDPRCSISNPSLHKRLAKGVPPELAISAAPRRI